MRQGLGCISATASLPPKVSLPLLRTTSCPFLPPPVSTFSEGLESYPPNRMFPRNTENNSLEFWEENMLCSGNKYVMHRKQVKVIKNTI